MVIDEDGDDDVYDDDDDAGTAWAESIRIVTFKIPKISAHALTPRLQQYTFYHF